MTIRSAAATTAAIPDFRSYDDHSRVLDLMWSQMPETQNRMSSSWWFFLLFPRDGETYGPRQLMFTIVARAGERVRINDVWLPGVDLRRSVVDGRDRFHSLNVGWYCDGRQVHHNYVDGAALTDMSVGDGYIRSLTEDGDKRYGIEYRRSDKRPVGMAAHICGRSGEARFEVWGALNSASDSPDVTADISTPLGGTHYIGWRRMQFEGEFDLPTGRETLSGIGFFQRVAMNFPLFPWKWIWTPFPDGTVFTAYLPYAGLNLFRKEYRFFNSNRLERAAATILPSAAWIPPGPAEPVRFRQVRATPILRDGGHPAFAVEVANGQGDRLSFLADCYGHTRYYVDRPLPAGGESHWDYNEYVFRMEGLDGRVAGRPITEATMGRAYGSLEYTWGLGL